MEALDESVVMAANIKTWTSTDPVLGQVKDMVLQGKKLPDNDVFKPYGSRFQELSVHDGCILWGSRVVVPPKRRQKMIEERKPPGNLSNEESGTFLRLVAKQELEKKVKTCQVCQQNRPSDKSVPIHPWEFPKRPWVRLHLDYAGPVNGNICFWC